MLGQPRPCGIGVVVVDAGERRELSEYLGRARTTSRANGHPADGRSCGQRASRADLHDSSYSIGVLTQGWKAKANTELVARVKRALAVMRDVRLIHVRGHAGIALNERADVLARTAVEQRSSTGGSPWRASPRSLRKGDQLVAGRA